MEAHLAAGAVKLQLAEAGKSSRDSELLSLQTRINELRSEAQLKASALCQARKIRVLDAKNVVFSGMAFVAEYGIGGLVNLLVSRNKRFTFVSATLLSLLYRGC